MIFLPIFSCRTKNALGKIIAHDLERSYSARFDSANSCGRKTSGNMSRERVPGWQGLRALAQ